MHDFAVFTLFRDKPVSVLVILEALKNIQFKNNEHLKLYHTVLSSTIRGESSFTDYHSTLD